MSDELGFPAASAAHEREHEREHGRDREMLLAALTEQQRFTEARFSSHADSHSSERELWTGAVAETNRVSALHLITHGEAHIAHAVLHEQEQEAVKIALAAEADKATIHSLAHAEQHRAHEEIHTREREARSVADAAMDKRLAGMNAVREQLRDYVPLATYQAALEASMRDRASLRDDIASMRTSGVAETSRYVSRELLDSKIEAATSVAAGERTRLEAAIKTVTEKVDALDKQLDLTAGRRSGVQAITSQTLILAGLLITLTIGIVSILANVLTGGP